MIAPQGPAHGPAMPPLTKIPITAPMIVPTFLTSGIVFRRFNKHVYSDATCLLPAGP